MISRDKQQRDEVDAIVNNRPLVINMNLQSEYEEFVKNNSQDGYSRAVVDYAEYWGRLMQLEIINKKTIPEIADATQEKLGFLGITGFQYGAAVSTLAKFWLYGKELKEWHNSRYGAPKDAKGVVNPAILTVGTK